MPTDEEPTFFDRERDRLAKEITSGFEELLSSSNGLNRKLEEVLGMTKEYDTIASLWNSFYELMKDSNAPEDTQDGEGEIRGLPGTGGHIVTSTNKKPNADTA
ncbi:hypothetical protein ONZ45_g4778 [Pleurotus djamor]|nr:hypothetical protein ONZ45_g4778 [Pleurotus djamor]